jgi:hypothetical protein
VKAIPARWEDLTDPRLFRAVGLADPTKSGSMTKAFEMIIQEQCRLAVHTAGFSDTQINVFEDKIQRAGLSPGWLPNGVPPEYQAAVEEGFFNGLNILRRMGANARYFTDAAQRVPMDAAAGAIAAGVSIDYYARIEAQVACAGQGGRAFTGFNMPMGGASAGGDPIALLCGAPHRETAVRFIEFVLGEEGQKLWCFRPGTPGGPCRTALYRPPVRRDFYPDWVGSRYEEFEPFLSYPLKDPSWNMYAVAQAFVYRPRWTAAHVDILRDLVRAMCIDSSESLQAAWREMIRHGGPAACPQAMALFEQWPGVPLPIRWAGLLEMKKAYDRRELLRIWTRAFRENYVRAREACL